eukprot:TRINITY_DN18125_c0_g1_i1.p1 TRINITY_DN18125_c0_g1~~TRINITY_DN18125_c0_g1_i1.p1  ORF type:complete len:114 (+),score=28.62 TRINITY_DN18125_c0_g1_i1:92-433(+)
MTVVDAENLALQQMHTAKKQKQQNMAILMSQEMQMGTGAGDAAAMVPPLQSAPIVEQEIPAELKELMEHLDKKKASNSARFSHLGETAEKMFLKLQDAFDNIPTEAVGPRIDE